jgi:hypothetical protein
MLRNQSSPGNFLERKAYLMGRSVRSAAKVVGDPVLVEKMEKVGP